MDQALSLKVSHADFAGKKNCFRWHDTPATPDTHRFFTSNLFNRVEIDEIAQHLRLILEKQAYCQQELEDDEGLLDEDEQAEFDALLISAAADLVGALAGVLGPSFVPYAQVFLPHIAKYYKDSKPTSERSMAIGSLGEITNGMGEGITEFTERLFPLIIKSLGDEDDEVRSNAAFAVGALCQNTSVDLSS